MCRTSRDKELPDAAEMEARDHVLVFAVLETGAVQVYGLVDDNLLPLLTEVSSVNNVRLMIFAFAVQIPDVIGAVSVTPSPSHTTHLTITSHCEPHPLIWSTFTLHYIQQQLKPDTSCKYSVFLLQSGQSYSMRKTLTR